MTESDNEHIPIFKRMGKNMQIVFVGVLAGVLIIGAYMTALGIMQMIEKPTISSTGEVGNGFLYQHNHFSSKDEIEIYNKDLFIKKVWIGTDIEYKAYKSNQLIAGDKKNLFVGPFVNSHDVSYKILLVPDMMQKIIIDNNNDIKTYLIIANGSKSDAKIIITEV